jgi:hypothetical protein
MLQVQHIKSQKKKTHTLAAVGPLSLTTQSLDVPRPSGMPVKTVMYCPMAIATAMMQA